MQEAVPEGSYMRIGELGRRLGVSPELLRAWERRYAVLDPARSVGGFRLYSDRDEARVRAMLRYVDGGLAAAEAARLAREDDSQLAGPAAAPSEAAARLVDALTSFDEGSAHAELDMLLARLTIDTVLRDVVLPALREIGNRWARGDITIGEEHFATNVLRGRLLGLGRGWDRGAGDRILLACPPGELHDLGLIAFGLMLRTHGRRITFLGSDTPVETVREVARRLLPQLVVLAAVAPQPLARIAEELAELARDVPLALAGAGASPELAERVGAVFVADDPVAAAEALTQG